MRASFSVGPHDLKSVLASFHINVHAREDQRRRGEIPNAGIFVSVGSGKGDQGPPGCWSQHAGLNERISVFVDLPVIYPAYYYGFPCLYCPTPGVGSPRLSCQWQLVS